MTQPISPANRADLYENFTRLLQQEQIPLHSTLLDNFEQIYLPLASWVSQQHQQKTEEPTLIIGINGSQGSGKSTLNKILHQLLEKGFNKRVFSLSIDDLYKTRAERKQLAKDIHPLLQTRGVPGTHDVALGIELFNRLKQGETETSYPRFDKATDDRYPSQQWPLYSGRPDIILFEGWCVGNRAEDDTRLHQPLNALERDEDPQGEWRRHVNAQLSSTYQQLFSLLDHLIMLEIPDFNKVHEWRTLQEKKLKQDKKQGMSAPEIERFIMHFERLTRHALNEMPGRADVVLKLDNEHQVRQMIIR